MARIITQFSDMDIFFREDKLTGVFLLVTGAYYCLNMIMITLSTFLSVIVINLYFRGDKRNRVPYWLKKVC